MHKIINLVFTFFLMSVSNVSYSQFASISFSNNNVIYNGDEALMTISISNYDCSQVYAKSDQGIVKKYRDCYYSFIPNETGKGRIKVYYIMAADTILTGILEFDIYDRPGPKAELNGKIKGEIKKEFLNREDSITGFFHINNKRWGNCDISNFQVIITRDNKIVFTHYNLSAKFDPSIKSALLTSQPGDRISFINIRGCLEKDGNYLNSIEFTIL